MMQQQSLEDVFANVKDFEDRRRDILARPESMAVACLDGTEKAIVRSGNVNADLRITDRVHEQIASRAEIPRNFYNELRENHRDLFEDMVNKLIRASDTPILMRCANRELRGFMSNRYRRLDSVEVLQNILPAFNDGREIDVPNSSFRFDERTGRMTLKIIFRDGGTDDHGGLRYGLFVENGEFGGKQLEITPGVFRMICSNGMISGDIPETVSRRHIGVPKVIECRARELPPSDRDNEDVWNQVRQYARALATSGGADVFGRLINRMATAKERPLETDPTRMGIYLEDEGDLQSDEADTVAELLEDGVEEATQFGLSQAVTRVAHDPEVVGDDYDRATKLEEYGGEIVDLDEDQWEAVNERADQRGDDDEEGVEIAIA